MVREKESYPIGLLVCPSGSAHCFRGKGGIEAQPQSVVRNCPRFEMVMLLGRVCRRTRAEIAGSTNPLSGSIKARACRAVAWAQAGLLSLDTLLFIALYC
jgi:hypothetical protein